jgi:hypothetical protein
MGRVTILVVAAVFALAVVGCGGGDEASDTDTVVATETTTDETTTDGAMTDETATTDLGELASGECLELAQAGQALGAALSAAGTSGSELDESSEAFQDFVDKAPEEIRADVQVLAEAYAKYADVLQDVDLQAGETPSAEDALKLSQALSAIDQAEVSAASERVAAWANENC